MTNSIKNAAKKTYMYMVYSLSYFMYCFLQFFYICKWIKKVLMIYYEIGS